MRFARWTDGRDTKPASRCGECGNGPAGIRDYGRSSLSGTLSPGSAHHHSPVAVVVFTVLPFLTPWFFRKHGGCVSELEAKYLWLLLFGLGGLATWAGSEAVLPAYIIGMVLAGPVGKDHQLIRRLRTLTFGLLTPFYFIRVGSLISVPDILAASPLKEPTVRRCRFAFLSR